MIYVKIGTAHAQKAKVFLTDVKLISKDNKVFHSARYVYFPINNYPATIKSLPHVLKGLEFEIVSRETPVEPRKKVLDYNKILDEILSSNERKDLASGYDAFGNIAVIEISEALRDKERAIGDAIIAGSKTITTVLAKNGPVKGIYRIRSVRYIAGKRTYMAAYKENGCEFRFDIRRVFFSPRLSFERSRVEELVSDGEAVAVPFAGVGPFAIEIAKKHPKSRVLAIELNGSAFAYMKRNMELNNVRNMEAIEGDFAVVAKQHKGFADRVVMPMPKTSLDFIDAACTISKKKGFFHIYTFCNTDSVEDKIKEIKNSFESNGRRFKLIKVRVVRPYSKNEIEIVVDAQAFKLH